MRLFLKYWEYFFLFVIDGYIELDIKAKYNALG